MSHSFPEHRTRCIRPLLVIVGVLLLAGSGCQWGTRPRNFPVATGAAGAQVAIRVTGEARDRLGELLAVDSGGLYLAQHSGPPPQTEFRRLTYIAWSRFRALDTEKLGGDHDLQPGRDVSEALKQRLAVVSRFRELTPELRERVLREFNQDTLDVVR